MPHDASHAFARQRLSIDFVTLKHACPKGVYVAPVPDEDLLWAGVVFVRRGPYANAVVRFQIGFTDDHPARPPAVTFLTEIFHPLVAPSTTYTYTTTTRERDSETISAADEEKLPPGGLTLRHGFPEWYSAQASTSGNTASRDAERPVMTRPVSAIEGGTAVKPHIIEVLQYLRIILDTEAAIDSVPLHMAANPGAWHAWRSYRARLVESSRHLLPSAIEGSISRDRSMSPGKQQPGGARRPGEWNWTGVWEDRVRKAVQASISHATLYGSDGNGQIEFVKMEDAAISKLAPMVAAHTE